MSAYGTNSYLVVNNFNYVSVLQTMFNTHTCDCIRKFTCTEQIILTINTTMILPVPGWYMGCSLIDSLLHSTLECYYDQMCIDSIYAAHMVWTWFPIPWNISAPRPGPLNTTRATMSRFSTNTTIRDCIKKLLVDDWHVETNFTAYYEECQPIQCSYTEGVRKNFISVVTTIIALLGGLMTVLNILVPNTVRFLRGPAAKFFRRLYARIGQRRTRISTVATIAH